MSPPDVLAGAARILCVRLDNAGDVLLTGPALRALRAALPHARIELLASRAGAAAATLLPWVDDVIVARVPWQDAGGRLPVDPDREEAFIASLRRRRYDAALIFTSFSQTSWPAAYALYLAGVPVRIAHAEGFGGSVLTHQVAPSRTPVHEAERDLHLLEAIGIRVADRTLGLAIRDRARGDVGRLLGDISGREFVLVAPGASCAARRWEPERYGEAAALIGRRAGLDVVVAGTVGERRATEVIAWASMGLDLAGRTDMGELAALVERASLVVTGNSLVMHLADALRRPAVVLYSGTDLPEHWRPRSTAHVLLSRPVPCAPCHRFDCPIGQPCLDIPPAEVAEAGLRLLAGQGPEDESHPSTVDRPVLARPHPGRSPAWTVSAS